MGNKEVKKGYQKLASMEYTIVFMYFYLVFFCS